MDCFYQGDHDTIAHVFPSFAILTLSASTLFLYRSLRDIIGVLLDFFFVQVYSDNLIIYFFAFIGFALSFCFSYSAVVELSKRQARRNGIAVWHLRCRHCHVKYRAVRPFGAVVPWEFPNEIDEADNVTDEGEDHDAIS